MTQQALPSNGQPQVGNGDPNNAPPGTLNQSPQQEQDARDAKAAADKAAAIQAYNNHFNYGGVAGGAQATAAYFNNGAQAAQGRQGEQIDYGAANTAYGQSQGARFGQDQMVGLMRARALGQVPLIAQMQADRQMGQATAAQMSAAASARGPAGLALAQQQAAGNIAGAQSNISNQAQINGAQEQQANQNAAFGAYSGMRGQDLQGSQQQADMAQKQAAINAAQRAQNDQYSMGQYGLANDVNKTQLGAQGNQIAIETGQQQAANNLAFQQSVHSDDNAWKVAGTVLGGVGTAAGVLGLLGLGGKSDPNSGQTRGVGGSDGGGSSGWGNPGSTPGGYDQNGMPVAGSGGGFDPDTDPSDVTAKRNISPLSYGMQGPSFEIPMQHDPATERQKAAAFDKMQAQIGAQYAGLMSQGPAVRDPATAQFAQGLAPSTYQYRDGIPGASPGMKMGPMAQNMAANPITGTAVRQMPNGMLGIDNKDGLKVALGGVGHLAQNQQVTDARIAQLEQQLRAQQQGLASQGPSVSPYQAGPVQGVADPRMAEADRMMADVNAQGTGLMSQGPSVGQQYLSYTRGQ